LLRRKIKAAVFFLICGVLALPAYADIITATFPGGSLPGTAQDLTGDSELSGIRGFLDPSDPNAVDMFAINIPVPLEFSAITEDLGAFGVPDPELFLFDSTGLGVIMNDDIDFSNTQACLPSLDLITNPCPALRDPTLGPLTPGVYYLAITRSANMPVDLSSNEIFSPSLSTDVVGPNPLLGGSNPIAGWDGGSFAQPDFDLGGFQIDLNFTPEPSFGVLTCAALAGLAILRRRSARR
jgi:hypothetical protein